MNHVLSQLPVRRQEWLVTLLMLLLFLAFVSTRVGELHEARMMLLMLMELFLPPAAGFLAAGMLAGDPTLEVLLSLPQPAPRTLLQRLTPIVVSLLLLGLLAQGAAGWWELALPRRGAAQTLIWLAPVLFYLGLGASTALIRGKVADGVLGVTICWLLGIASLEPLMRVCAERVTPSCHAAIVTPLLTLFRPYDPIWWSNRLLLALFGLALLAAALYLAGREEPLVYSLATDSKE